MQQLFNARSIAQQQNAVMASATIAGAAKNGVANGPLVSVQQVGEPDSRFRVGDMLPEMANTNKSDSFRNWVPSFLGSNPGNVTQF